MLVWVTLMVRVEVALVVLNGVIVVVRGVSTQLQTCPMKLLAWLRILLQAACGFKEVVVVVVEHLVVVGGALVVVVEDFVVVECDAFCTCRFAFALAISTVVVVVVVSVAVLGIES